MLDETKKQYKSDHLLLLTAILNVVKQLLFIITGISNLFATLYAIKNLILQIHNIFAMILKI